MRPPVAQVYLERNGNGKTPFKIQARKPAPKAKAKAKPRTSSPRGFQTFGDMTAEASGDGSEPERFREAIKSGGLATVESVRSEPFPCAPRCPSVPLGAPRCSSGARANASCLC